MIDTNNKNIQIVAPPIYHVKLTSIDPRECVKKFNTLMNYLQENTKNDKLFAFSKTDKLKEITKLKVTFK
jgi:translation initiation factor 2 alpha subunit (eIF-2alpha)